MAQNPKILVEICVGTTCCLMGCSEIIEYLEGLPESLKNQIEIGFISCFNHCNQGPKVKVDGVMLEKATPDQVLELIEAGLVKEE